MSKKSGDAAGGPEHPILKQLAWLKVHIRHRNTSSNFDTQDQAEEEEEEEEEEEAAEVASSQPGSSSTPPPTPSPPPPTDVGSLPPSQSSHPGATKRRRRTTEVADPVDAALLETLQAWRREEQESKNVFSSFTGYLNTVLQDLPATDGKKLMKEIQQLMLNYL
ncbi:unnamed protein product [Boreogadus saida]